MKKRTLFLCGMLLLGSMFMSTGYAAEAYNSNSHYEGGSEVVYNGGIYRAKWWVNQGQPPSDAAANPWDTPWELIGTAAPSTNNQENTVVQPAPANQPNVVAPSTQQPVDVSSYPSYVKNTKYKSGDVVSSGGQLYRCKAGLSNWCSGAAWAYAPGEGNAWDSAWDLVNGAASGQNTVSPGTLNNAQSSVNTNVSAAAASTPAPVSNTNNTNGYLEYVEKNSYASGDVVSSGGQLYRCKAGLSNWCSGVAWAYAPGVGNAWDSAWDLISEGANNPATTTREAQPGYKTDYSSKEVQSPTTQPVKGGETVAVQTANQQNQETGFSITRAELERLENELTSFPAMQVVKDAIVTLDNDVVEQIYPLGPANPDNVKRVESFLSEADWEHLFPLRAPEYTYRRFLQAVGKFPALCADYTDGRNADAICRKSLATMFAHFAQETGGHETWRDEPEWRQGLVYVRELGWTEGMRGGYNGECNPEVWQGQTWPCGKFDNGEFKSYFGRGAKQLSYNYNYGPFSEAMFGTVRTLLDEPELVADSWLNLASAIFFYVYPQPPKPSMLHVIDGTWQPNQADLNNGLVPGFGVTIQIINGGVECGGSDDIAQGKNRISYYRSFAEYFEVPIPADEILGCAGMKQFDSSGSGALEIFWEQDWGWRGDTNAAGDSYACQLKGYQTPFSAFKQGDYAKCVEHFFPDVNIIE